MPAPGSASTLFIINPISGGKTKTDWETAIRDFYGSSTETFDFYILSGTDDESSIRHWIEKVAPTKVVAVGGDGTVSLVAKQLLSTGISLGILPAGSANGMAKELGLPLTATEALNVIRTGTSKNADVIKINDKHYCLHLSDIGLNALLIKNFEEGKIRGKLGYATKVVKTLWTKSRLTLDINIKGERVQADALMVVLANARMYGTGAVINPEGNMYDGKFEVVIMKRLALSEIIKMFFRPGQFNPEKIKLYPATSVTIKSKRRVHFQVDGEYLGKVNTVKAEILAGELKIIVP